MTESQFVRIQEHKKQVIPKKQNTKGIQCTNSLDLKDIMQCIDDAFRKQEPAELIFAHIETLPTKESKANICRELSQRYWTQNTRIGHDLSLKFAKLARQFETVV